MQNFEYASPTNLKDALALLGSKWGETDVLAGGTDEISLMKDFLHTPKRLVNIKGIKELGGISRTSEGWRIGATVTFDELASNASIHSEYPSLHSAVMGVTSPQIRNMGTAGGDLCQRPRCWYFRRGFGLLGMQDGKSLVPNGDNRYHSIFGNGPAYFVNPSSLAPALIALGARVRLQSATGTRNVPVYNFFVKPQTESGREIILQPNEILTDILVPPARGISNATYEVRQKDALDWPLVTASVALRMDGDKVVVPRVVLGHVAPTPWPAVAAEASLIGKSLSADVIEKAAAVAAAGASPLSMNAYKVQLVKVAVKRALLAASGRA